MSRGCCGNVFVIDNWVDINFVASTLFGAFFVDFVCLEKKLVIEVDGGQHAKNVEADVKRSYYLKERGYRVLRFWNNEVLEESESVLSVILSSVVKDDPPHPDPLPPKVGGEGDVGQDWPGEEGI